MKKLIIRNVNFADNLTQVDSLLGSDYRLLLCEQSGKLLISGFDGKLLISSLCDAFQVTRGFSVMIDHDAVDDLIDMALHQNFSTLLFSGNSVIINDKDHTVIENTLKPRPPMFSNVVIGKQGLLNIDNKTILIETTRSQLFLFDRGESYRTTIINKVLSAIKSDRVGICVHDTLLFIRDDLSRSTTYIIEPE